MRVGVAQNRALEFTVPFRAFTFTVDTTKAGATTSVQYQLPLQSSGTYDFVVDWGDGSSDSINIWSDAAKIHTFSVGGVKTISITGIFNVWGSYNEGDAGKLITIPQFGNVAFKSLDFSKGVNFTGGLTDIPNFSDIVGSAINNILWDCDLFNDSIDNWDVSNVLNFQQAFRGLGTYNQPLNSWNTSAVTNMTATFYQATSFNQPLNSWNVSSCINMTNCFNQATSFNQDLGAWDVSSCTNMTNMFLSSGMTQANYDLLLIGWTGWSGGVATKSVQSSVPFGIGTVPYTLGGDAQAAHDWLTGTKLWTITDGGGI